MPITTPASLVLTNKAKLLAPAMALEPLKSVMKNINYLWKFHTPPLLSVVYNTDALASRDTEYHIPILPSADGLDYVFVHRFECDQATQTVTVYVDTCTTYAGAGTAWTNVYSTAEVTAGANVVKISTSAAYTIAANVVAIRCRYTDPGAAGKTDHGVTMYPAPGDAVAAKKTSGFQSFDSAALDAATGAAITEEHIKRCASSSRAVAEDRRQCAFAFVQEYSSAPHFVCSDAILGSAANGYSLPAVWARLPQFSAHTITLRCIAEVSAGATAAKVKLGIQAGESTTFAASGSIESGTISLSTSNSILAGGGNFVLSANNTAGNSTRIFALIGWYTPIVPQDDIVAWASDNYPSAKAYLLATAANRVEALAVLPYCGTAHLFDGLTTNLRTRYLGALVGPGSERARANVSRSWTAGTNTSTYGPSTITGTTSAVVTQVEWPLENSSSPTGTFGTLGAASDVVTSGDTDSATSGDTTIDLAQGTMVPYIEELTVTDMAGVAVFVSRQLEAFGEV